MKLKVIINKNLNKSKYISEITFIKSQSLQGILLYFIN